MHRLAASGIALGLVLCAPRVHADEQPSVSARVLSTESVETLARRACGLVAVAKVGGHARLFDVSVDGKRCSSLAAQDDAVVLRVRIEPRPDDDRMVVFEADVPEGMHSKEMLDAVNGAASELVDGMNVTKQTTEPPRDDVPVDDSRPSSTSTSSGAHTRGPGIALMVTGGVALGVAAIVGVGMLVDSVGHAFGCGIVSLGGGSCGHQDLSSYGIAAGSAAGLGTILLITGGILLSLSPSKSVSAQLGPTGGSLRVTF